jgi:hypothetical protein
VASTLYPPTDLDANQVIQHVYDEANQRLRVDTEAVVVGGQFEVSLDPSEDGVYIADKDSGNELKVNADGSINVVASTGSLTSPTIYNSNITLANTEYSLTFPANTKQIMIKSRKGTIQFSFISGQSGTNYITIPLGASYKEENLGASLTIYFRSSKANDVLESISWV